MGGDDASNGIETSAKRVSFEAAAKGAPSFAPDWRSATVGGATLLRDREAPNPTFDPENAGHSSNATRSSADDAVPLLGKPTIYE